MSFTNDFYQQVLEIAVVGSFIVGGLPCKHYLLRAYQSRQPIPHSLVHPRYWLQGTPIQHTVWQPVYPGEEQRVYNELVQVEARSTGQLLAELREQMEPEEKARFDRQVEAE
jgi:hypothetical protein